MTMFRHSSTNSTLFAFFYLLSISCTVVDTTVQEDRFQPLNLTGNPFAGRKLFAHETWRENVLMSAASIEDPTLKARVLATKDVGTFLWLSISIPALNTHV
jgi:hypothetical protein